MSTATVPHAEPLHKSSLLDLLDRPIAFHRCFVDLTGSVAAALMLSQAVYWTRIKRREKPESDGWFYKTQAEWEEETALKRHDQERARKALRDTTFWCEDRRGLPAKLYFSVDLEALERALRQLPAPRPLRGKNPQQNHQSAGSKQTRVSPPSTQDREDATDQNAKSPQPITETSPETMVSETTPDISSNVEANVAKDRVNISWPLRLNDQQQDLVKELERQLDTHSRGAFCRIVSDRGLGEDVAYRLFREAMEVEDAGQIKTSISQYFMNACQREAQRQGIDLGFKRAREEDPRC
jgi:hypothetical protein